MDTQPCAAGQQGDPENDATDALRAQITAEFCNRPVAVRATTYLRRWQTNAKPVALLCEGGGRYVVKALQATRMAEMGRILVNEQIVARLGGLIHAPVTSVALIDVPAELIANQPEMSHMMAGIAHGSQFVENVTDQLGFDHTTVPENRQRFALLSVLYGWVGAQDHQFVYSKAVPQLVYSVDHGFFFPGQAAWTPASLTTAGAAQPDAQVTNACTTTQPELHKALHRLSAIGDEALIAIAALPPDQWGLTMEDRIALVNFLKRRRVELLAGLPVSN